MSKDNSHTHLEGRLRKLGHSLKIASGIKEDLRSEIMGRIVTTKRLPKQKPLGRWALNWAPGLAVLLIVITSSTAVVADTAKPGDLLYPVDLLAEKIERNLVQDEIAKAKLYAAVSEERVAEKEAVEATDPTTLDDKDRSRWEKAKVQAEEQASASLERLNQVQSVVLEKYDKTDKSAQKEAYLKLFKSLQQVIDRKAKRAKTLEEILKETADTNKDKDDNSFKLNEKTKERIRTQIRKEFKADQPQRGQNKPNDYIIPDPNIPEDLQKQPRDTNKNGIPDQDEPWLPRLMDEDECKYKDEDNGLCFGNNSLIESGVNQILNP